MDGSIIVAGTGVGISLVVQVGTFGYIIGRLRESASNQDKTTGLFKEFVTARMADQAQYQSGLLESFKHFTDATLKTLGGRLDGGYNTIQRLESENTKAQVAIGGLRENLASHERNEGERFAAVDRRFDKVETAVEAVGRRVDGNVAQIQAVVRGELASFEKTFGK